MNKITRRGRAGLVAVAVAAALIVAPAVSASAAIVPTVGSDKDLYIMDGETGEQIPAGTSLGWNAVVISSPDAVDVNAVYPSPAGTTIVRTFIAPRGQERNFGAWNAYAGLGNPAQILQQSLTPSGNTTPGLGSPSGGGAVGMAGGDYSLGIAFMVDSTKQVLEADFTYITVTGNANPALATWTFDTPVQTTAPAITTQPTSASVNPGATATFSAAASGSPAPTVQWQSAAAGSSSFANIAGATSASYTTPATTLANSGTQYRAVFTNAAGSATTNAATLTVALVAPNEPVAGDPKQVTIANPAAGATVVTFNAGAGNESKTLTAWAFSTPTNLGPVTTDASGNVTVDLGASLPKGDHTIVLTQPGDAAFTPVAWGTVSITAADWSTGDPATNGAADFPVAATITTSNRFELKSKDGSIDLGSARRGQSTSANDVFDGLTVIDDRDNRKGWTLDAALADVFTNAERGDTAPKSALTITPKAVTAALPTGVAAGVAGDGASVRLAEGQADSFTDETGVDFDANMSFAAPANAKAGTYTATLNVTLVSK